MATRKELWNTFKASVGLLAVTLLFACQNQAATPTPTVVRPAITLPPPTLTLPLPVQPSPTVRPEVTPIVTENVLQQKLAEIYGHPVPVYFQNFTLPEAEAFAETSILPLEFLIQLQRDAGANTLLDTQSVVVRKLNSTEQYAAVDRDNKTKSVTIAFTDFSVTKPSVILNEFVGGFMELPKINGLRSPFFGDVASSLIQILYEDQHGSMLDETGNPIRWKEAVMTGDGFIPLQNQDYTPLTQRYSELLGLYPNELMLARLLEPLNWIAAKTMTEHAGGFKEATDLMLQWIGDSNLVDERLTATMGQLKRERIFDPDTRLTQPREIFFAATLLSVPSSERELAVMRGVLNPNLTFSSNARPTPALLSRAVNMVSTPKGILRGEFGPLTSPPSSIFQIIIPPKEEFQKPGVLFIQTNPSQKPIPLPNPATIK
ncbi:hypothetical protein A3C28_01785 [Candidatus Roizmanbacteria bacterium RIFCSPHIGHO2_02_FULL_39_9]|uniref:Cell envelope-related transcriptional attenuator domain-containing protein n=1 Tax=Candidatus Roizmanbacteria bacterium RIFCSPHIGHO2_02_FULL_39_9 TaxID=1802040 RepID=A0A1F7H5F9_9BACT|nr:MAG: hypothetical protein A3C28_01785 [Candidatus Roizmanbacteria bacterium RIFCSPHIGHO2_02_FULL_39_9]